MEAIIKETGERIKVWPNYYPTIYKEAIPHGGREFDEDELELIIPPRPKIVKLDDAVRWLEDNASRYVVDMYINGVNMTVLSSQLFEDFKKKFEDE